MTNPITQTDEIRTGLSVNARGSLIPTEQLRALCDAANAPHSYDTDPVVAKMTADAFNSGVMAGAGVVQNWAVSLAGDGQPPETLPWRTLQDLYDQITVKVVDVPSVPDAFVKGD